MIRIHTAAGLYPQAPLSRNGLARLLEEIAEALDIDVEQVIVNIVGDAESRHANENFLKLPGPTNVLAFEASCDQEESESGRPPLSGEILLNADALMRESLLYGQPPAEHLVRLLAHACLHLVGFDHGPLMDDLMEAAVQHVMEVFCGDSISCRVFPF
ncbi:rRNA maturation RNase YbeY [Desulfovibrio inopinatus]|uniref:rRNA maturation RNase YbeY n=1 Tax=Desulfovibrio inopinatus TaxID=102109 RepID=UPI00041C29B1|nr:rRNA maturation RNase YbeY [Desulfovibrio inopinatus]